MENKYSNRYVLETAIAIQSASGNKPSAFFMEQAERCMNDEITLDELEKIIDDHYKNLKDKKS